MFLGRCQYQNKKIFVYWLNFLEGFETYLIFFFKLIISLYVTSKLFQGQHKS